MVSLHPLKSVISINDVDDTSLALPSVNQYRSGQQRVLEQVQTIRRTKSRQSSSKGGSTSLSPTSPVYDPVFIDTPRAQSSSSNGSVFFGNGYSKALSIERNNNWQAINNAKRSTVKRNTAASTYQYERSYAPVGAMAVGQTNTSRSEPDLAWQRSMPKRSGPPAQRLLSKRATSMAERPSSLFIMNGTNHTKSSPQFICSQVDGLKTSSKPSVIETALKSRVDSGSSANCGIADITMKEAVEYLSNADETYQHCGASYIQHNTFIDDKAKEEVVYPVTISYCQTAYNLAANEGGNIHNMFFCQYES